MNDRTHNNIPINYQTNFIEKIGGKKLLRNTLLVQRMQALQSGIA